MAPIGDYLQRADWKKEKHVPVITCPDSVKAGEKCKIKVVVGKEVAHPNTTEHHIRWIHLFFQPEGEKVTYHLASIDFAAHGESTQGVNQGPLYTEPDIQVVAQLRKSGTLHATSFCNIHGLWENSREIIVIG